MIHIKKLNEVFVQFSSEDSGVLMELSDYFTFMVEGYRFMPSYRNKTFDGKIRIFNRRNNSLPYGLIPQACEMLHSRGYKMTFDEQITKDWRPTHGELIEWMETLQLTSKGEEIVPHDYQIEAFQYALSEKRRLIISPTGSGKSLILYMMARWFIENGPEQRVLIVVPTTSLVEQLTSDFADYSSTDLGFSADEEIHKIYSGQEKDDGKKRIVITTWQSAINYPPNWFLQFGMVLGDECHLFKSKSLDTIMKSLFNASWRIGSTGTLDGCLTNERVLVGHFGPIHKVTTTHELMKAGTLSDMTIECVVIDHSEADRKVVSKFKYMDEISTIVSDPKRNQKICELAGAETGNVLVLFNRVDTHGKPLMELMKATGRPVFYISGETPTAERERIRHEIETHTNAILCASFATCSTGINIKNLHCVLFAAPNKSQIRVLQSIGRGLRKAENGQALKVIDISDDYSWKTKKNHTLNHALHRVKIYAREKFKYTTRSIKL